MKNSHEIAEYLNLDAITSLLEKTIEHHLNHDQCQVQCLLQGYCLSIIINYPQPLAIDNQAILPLLEQVLHLIEITDNYQTPIYFVAREINTIDLFSSLALTDNKSAEINSLLTLSQANSNLDFVEQKSNINSIAQSPANKRIAIRSICTLGIGLILGGFYLFQRPCAIGSCFSLTSTDQNLQTLAKTITEQAEDIGQIIALQAELNNSIQQLKKVPQWSKNFPAATKLISIYQQKYSYLARLVNVAENRQKIINQINQSALSLVKLQAIEAEINKAIATLKTIPQQDSLFYLAKTEIDIYQGYQRQIQETILQEKVALQKLQQAEQILQINQLAENQAQTAQQWQKIATNWQKFIANLQAIPATTTVYLTAQQLLSEYSPQLAISKTRYTQAKKAEDLYAQAEIATNLAKKAEKQRQWSKATNQWQVALNSLKQIPRNTFQYNQVPTLVANYENALQLSRQELKLALKIQQAKQDLAKTCTTQTSICQYQIKDQKITVNLKPTYTQRIWQTGLNAQLPGNKPLQTQLVAHLNNLENNLKLISKNINSPLEVYHSNGNLLIQYQP